MKKRWLIIFILIICSSLFGVSKNSEQIKTAIKSNDLYSLKLYVSISDDDVLHINNYGESTNIYKYVIDYGNASLLQILLDAGLDANEKFKYW